MAKIPVMDAVVSILEDEGVEVIFGIPGAGILPFYQSIQHSKKIRHYISRHEEGAIHAADGYARATGRVGVCSCTSGPAGTNFVTGLYTAQVDSIPIIAITGQNVRAQLGKEAFQAVDIAEVVKPITKKSWCVTEAYQIPWVFKQAFKIAREGRPGPVLIDLPLDVQRAQIEWDSSIDSRLEYSVPKPSRKKVERAVDMILKANYPVLLSGGGVIISNASNELIKLAEYLSIPVVTTLMGKGSIPADHPLYAGQVGIQCNTRSGNRTFLDSDLVVGIGCRFSDRHTGALDVYTKGRKFIHVDIEPFQIGRIIPTDLGIVSDAKLALEAMLETAKQKTQQRVPSDKVKDIPELREKLVRKMDYGNIPIKPMRVFKEINEFFSRDTIFVTCIGLNQIWSGQFQHSFNPRHYLVPGGAGPLGWDLPAAIGAKIAYPDKQVVQVVGDFGFGFCMEELAMAVMYNLPIVIVIINNGYLSLIRQTEKYTYNFEFAVDIWYDGHMVNFTKLAEAYGAYGEMVLKPEDIKPAFMRAINSRRPAIIDIIVERDTDASMGSAIDNIREFEEEKEKESKEKKAAA